MSYVASVGDTAADLDMEAASGADWTQTVTLTNADGTPYVTTGRTYAMQVRQRQGGPVIATVTVTALANVLTLAVDLASVLPRLARYDVWETVTAGGARKPLLRGFFRVEPGVTA